MRITLTPGPCDHEKVETICQIYQTANPDEWEQFVLDCADDEAWLDALCHAAGNIGKRALAEQEQYFHDLLLGDERNYFAARLGGFEL